MKTETLYMSPEIFTLTLMSAFWMKAKVQQAMEQQTLLQVEVMKLPDGKTVVSDLNVVQGR